MPTVGNKVRFVDLNGAHDEGIVWAEAPERGAWWLAVRGAYVKVRKAPMTANKWPGKWVVIV